MHFPDEGAEGCTKQSGLTEPRGLKESECRRKGKKETSPFIPPGMIRHRTLPHRPFQMEKRLQKRGKFEEFSHLSGWFFYGERRSRGRKQNEGSGGCIMSSPIGERKKGSSIPVKPVVARPRRGEGGDRQPLFKERVYRLDIDYDLYLNMIIYPAVKKIKRLFFPFRYQKVAPSAGIWGIVRERTQRRDFPCIKIRTRMRFAPC